MAPIFTTASVAIAASGDIGRKMPTRSPSPTPSASSALASRFTSAASSAYLSVRLWPSSPSQMMAGLAPRPASTWRSTQLSVKFRRPPGNHVGHSMPRASSSTRVYGVVHRTPRSFTTASQYHSRSAIERRCSSSSVAMPCAFMNRAMRDFSRCSLLGRQTMLSVLMAPYSKPRPASPRPRRRRALRLGAERQAEIAHRLFAVVDAGPAYFGEAKRRVKRVRRRVGGLDVHLADHDVVPGHLRAANEIAVEQSGQPATARARGHDDAVDVHEARVALPEPQIVRAVVAGALVEGQQERVQLAHAPRVERLAQQREQLAGLQPRQLRRVPVVEREHLAMEVARDRQRCSHRRHDTPLPAPENKRPATTGW